MSGLNGGRHGYKKISLPKRPIYCHFCFRPPSLTQLVPRQFDTGSSPPADTGQALGMPCAEPNYRHTSFAVGTAEEAVISLAPRASALCCQYLRLRRRRARASRRACGEGDRGDRGKNDCLRFLTSRPRTRIQLQSRAGIHPRTVLTPQMLPGGPGPLRSFFL